jgi:PST family polysaccharide transporter/teichuronic acid exporter
LSIRNKAIKGVKWTTLSTVFIAVASIIKLSILSRYLDKEAFGLMALVNVVLGFMNLFMDLGLATAILHFQNMTKKEYASLYWTNILMSLMLFLLLVVISPFIAGFYQEPELGLILILMSLSVLIAAIGRQFKTIEQKELNFKIISIIEISSTVASLILAIILALLDFGVYALVLSALCYYLITNLAFFIRGVVKNGLLFHLKFKETRKFLKIGLYQMGGQTLNYFNKDLDILIIGKLLGTEVLGGYSLAKQLVAKPAMIINPILMKVLSPTLSKYQDNPEELNSKYLKVNRSLTTVNFFAYLGIIIFAPFLVDLLYGDNFAHIAPLVQLLSIYMYIRSIYNPVGSLVVATGRTNLGFKWNIILTLIMPVFIYVGSFYGVHGVAIGLFSLLIIMIYPFWSIIIRKMIAVSFKEYITVFKWNLPYLISIFKNNLLKR